MSTEREQEIAARFLEISRHELPRASPAWLFDCLERFYALVPGPVIGDGGNLIMLWREDFARLLSERTARQALERELDVERLDNEVYFKRAKAAEAKLSQLQIALKQISSMAGSHTVPAFGDNHPAGYSAIYRTAEAALKESA